MDSASSLAYPGSRAVAGLFRSLERYQPTALWVGYLWVHRVEALTESAERRPFDGLSLHILEAIATGLQPLAARLHLPAAAVHQLSADDPDGANSTASVRDRGGYARPDTDERSRDHWRTTYSDG